MPETVKHNSSQDGCLSQLDSVFAQIRKKAAMEGGQWELEVLKDGQTTVLQFTHKAPEKPDPKTT